MPRFPATPHPQNDRSSRDEHPHPHTPTHTRRAAPISVSVSSQTMSDLEKGEHGGAGADNNIAAHRRPYNQDGPLRQPALGNEAQPVYRVQTEGRKLANPAPLGLCGFALTTFVLASINLGTRGITHPNIVTGAAFGYGGLVQLLAGMW